MMYFNLRVGTEVHPQKKEEIEFRDCVVHKRATMMVEILYAILQQQTISWRKMMLSSESSVLSSLGNPHGSAVKCFDSTEERLYSEL